MDALKGQDKDYAQNDKKYLTIALAKGRLASKTMEMLEKVGITCDEMKDKDTRKLIFTDEKHGLQFFLAKGPDVPTYVEYGAADIGVVGKDTIVEEDRDVFEVLDLGFGKCRMCVCGPKDKAELLAHREQIRVASKYPKIAKDYFFNRKHQTVDIIKLAGSVELGPIVGLSDVIVDIVETGSTLKENGLDVLEEIMPLSARVIVNPVAMQMESEKIKDLVGKLRSLLKEDGEKGKDRS
ncbi:MAG: ATP phosphoribosyltransferase [Lachnospiraceae bacterium]|nr:ATP phosphoribosyltransferase [Lachnospiraceae bacterium]